MGAKLTRGRRVMFNFMCQIDWGTEYPDILKNIYLFIWLCQLLVAAGRLLSCGMQASQLQLTWLLSCGMQTLSCGM